MEFRCRLGTPSGEIIEGVYVAQSEVALRRELEDKGLHVLSLRTRGAVCRPWPARGGATRSPVTSFWYSTRSWRRCSKPACRWSSRSTFSASRLTNPVFKAVLDDVHEKVRGGTALSDAFIAHGELFPSVYTASLMAGERAGNLDAVLRRFVAYSKTIDTVRSEDDLGDGLSGDPDSAGASSWSASSSSRWCRRSRSSTAASTRSCRCPRASSSASRNSCARRSC